MPYHKTSTGHKVGDEVTLTKKHKSCSGYFERGDIVKITEIDPMRGYSVVDEAGNSMNEMGFEL